MNDASNIGPRPRWQRRLVRYGPVLAWVALIFFFSSGSASAAQTSRIIRPILVFLFPSASAETLLAYHFFIRKCAHFAEYALLALWVIRALAGSSLAPLKRHRFSAAVLLVLAVAALDEFNQSFEPSRTSTVWDVLLDLSGGLAMAIVLGAAAFWKAKRKGH